MIYKTELTRENCDLPRISMGDYVVVTVPEAGITTAIRLGESKFCGCEGCPIDIIRRSEHVVIRCSRGENGLICTGGDFYDAEITDMLEEI